MSGKGLMVPRCTRAPGCPMGPGMAAFWAVLLVPAAAGSLWGELRSGALPLAAISNPGGAKLPGSASKKWSGMRQTWD